MKLTQALGIILSSFVFLLVSQASAHVVVKPNTIGIGSTETFKVNVPTEKDIPTVGLRLLIPSGVTSVVPLVKPGWTISLKKDGDTVTEIDWSNGTIPPEQKDEFSFSAKVPAKETTLIWKAYQEYADGSIVEWTHAPSKNEDDDANPPYSTTKVMNDLGSAPPIAPTTDPSLRVISYSALGIGIVALGMSLAKRKK